MIKINSINPKNNHLVVNWNDGTNDSFHYVWLRDHLQDSDFFDSNTKERLVDAHTYLTNTQPNEINIKNDAVNKQLELASEQLEILKKDFDKQYKEKEEKLTSGDDLAPGVQKMVKVYLAVKRRIQPGDKIEAIDGSRVRDIIDYRFKISDENIVLRIRQDGAIKEYDLSLIHI